LGEVENVLLQHPLIREAAVIVHENASQDKHLVAYFVAQDGSSVEGAAVRSYLREKLPDYMIPSAYVILDALPLNANGKVDRKALPVPDYRSVVDQYEFIEPEGKYEVLLAEIWRDLLKVERVGVHDNFFDLGGHSLLGTRMVAAIEKQTGKQLPLLKLFQFPTIGELAKYFEEDSSEEFERLGGIQISGKGNPFFFLSSFFDLGRLLASERPFYSLPSSVEEDAQDPETAVQRQAQRSIQEMRKIQAKGPYFVGGHCFGSVVAFEIAKQLIESGEKVGFLAMMEPPILFPLSRYQWAYRRYRYHFKKFIAQKPTQQWKYLKMRMRNVRDRTMDPVKILELESGAKIYEKYRPELISAKITLFLSDDSYFTASGERDFRLLWKSVASEGVDVFRFPGDHVTMCQEPHVQMLAERLKECLNEAEEVSIGKNPGADFKTEEPVGAR
jgi:thioesterase domain-containing protein/acyl carrier protein